MAFDNLLLERDGAMAIVTINRPSVLNALNAATLDELQRLVRDLQRDDTVRVVILTGAGGKSFVAGADIRELAAQTPVGAREYALAGQQVFDLIENLGKPVIAAINGYALGGGCELAMACTLRVAADTARIGQPEVALGLLPAYGGTQRLPRLVGRSKAMEMMLTGTPIAMRYIISAVNAGAGIPFAEACQHEAALFGLVAATEDMREGTRAFLEKRTPQFKGR